MLSPNLPRVSITRSAGICAAARAPERVANATCRPSARLGDYSRACRPSHSKEVLAGWMGQEDQSPVVVVHLDVKVVKNAQAAPACAPERELEIEIPLELQKPKADKALTLVNFVTDDQQLIDQVAVPRNTNEEAAVAAHFPTMDLKGVCLTADAAHTTKANARQLTQGNGADYLMSLKANQPHALAKAQQLLSGAIPPCSPHDRQRPWTN